MECEPKNGKGMSDVFNGTKKIMFTFTLNLHLCFKHGIDFMLVQYPKSLQKISFLSFLPIVFPFDQNCAHSEFVVNRKKAANCSYEWCCLVSFMLSCLYFNI